MTLWTALRRHAGDGGPPARARLLAGTGAALAGLVLLGACGTSTGANDRASLAASEPTADSGEVTTDPQIAPEPGGTPTPVGGRPWDDGVSRECARSVPGGAAGGMTEVAQTADGAGVTSFWSGAAEVAVCDVLQDPDSDEVLSLTMNTARRDAPRGFDEDRLSLSTLVVGPETDPSAVRFVAGGLLPWPVEQISYTFPDGHTAEAQFVSSVDGSDETWWVVAYTATDGPLVDPTTTTAELEPVTISIVGAAAEAFRLPWEDLQRNE